MKKIFHLLWLAPFLPGCGEKIPDVPQKEIAFDQRSALGFAVSDITDFGTTVKTDLEWTSSAEGFSAVPNDGSTRVESSLAYENGSIMEVGSPAQYVETNLVLRIVTADGLLQEETPCVLRARGASSWSCDATLQSLHGEFRVVEHPPGALRYLLWMSRSGRQLRGGVGALIESSSDGTDGPSSGSGSAFYAGMWSKE